MSRRSNGWVTHAIAQCQDCCWRNEDYRTALRKGREHSKRKNHTVNVEVGKVYYYYKEVK